MVGEGMVGEGMVGEGIGGGKKRGYWVNYNIRFIFSSKVEKDW